MQLHKITVVVLSSGFMLSCADQHSDTTVSNQVVIDNTIATSLNASEIVETKESTNQEESACHKGMIQAKTDTRKGIIGYYFWGIGIPLYADTLEKKYDMLIHRKGCVVYSGEAESWTCYNRFMDSVILAKYHVNLIKQEDQKSRQWIRELQAK